MAVSQSRDAVYSNCMQGLRARWLLAVMVLLPAGCDESTHGLSPMDAGSTLDAQLEMPDTNVPNEDDATPTHMDAQIDATIADGGIPVDASVEADATEPIACATAQEMFETRIWPEIMSPRCLACHTNAGIARRSAFVLTTPLDDPNTFLELSFRTVADMAAVKRPQFDDRSLLELKPTLTVPHEGREVIEPDSALHQLLMAFIDRIDGIPCEEEEPPIVVEDYFRGVTFMAPAALLRRVTLNLAARSPTIEELEIVASEGMDGFQRVLESVLEGEGFISRIKEGFNDILMTPGYDAAAGALLPHAFFDQTRHWPQAMYDPPQSWDVTREYDRALRQEPVELIAHIVRQNRPFTQILNADYTVVSPYTARGYGIFDGIRENFVDPDNPFEFIEARLPALTHRNGQVMPSENGLFPHAGLMTTPPFLNRYPNTDTNRNRARARFFYQFFLGFDVMASAPVVNDSAAVTARFDNPTLEAPDCVTCHQIIDPVAGLFQEFDNKGDYHFRPEPWYGDMLPPGFEVEVMPEDESWRRLTWLGDQASSDPRFAIAMAEHVYYILTQDKILSAPQAGDENEREMRKGYAAQRTALTEAAIAFQAENFNLKALFRSLTNSRFYRANGLSEPVDDPSRLAELEALGLGAMVTPEQLFRRVLRIFGTRLSLDKSIPDQFNSTYLLYGGIDYAEVTERAVTPNGAIGGMMRMHAHHISCRVALREFWDNQAEGISLFPFVDHTTADEGAIRQNLVWLHKLILGQYIEADHLEIERSYGLFNDVVQAGAARVAAGEEDRRLVYDCRAEEPAPADPDYIMRGWQAVIYYLVLRPEFLLQ